MTVKVNGVAKEAPITIVRDKGPNLVGRDWFKFFSDLVRDLNHCSVVNKRTFSDVLKNKNMLFANDLGILRCTQARIYMDPNAQAKFFVKLSQ